MEYLGAWGTLIHEKNLKSKISCQTPFKMRKNVGTNTTEPILFYDNLWMEDVGWLFCIKQQLFSALPLSSTGRDHFEISASFYNSLGMFSPKSTRKS